MKWFLTLTFLVTVTNLRAEVDPKHVSAMLDQMVRENVISSVEAEKAKFRLKGMNSEQWKQINQQASKIAARSPASLSQNKIEEVHGIDLDGAQFKEIQKEMKKIVPQYKN